MKKTPSSPCSPCKTKFPDQAVVFTAVNTGVVLMPQQSQVRVHFITHENKMLAFDLTLEESYKLGSQLERVQLLYHSGGNHE